MESWQFIPVFTNSQTLDHVLRSIYNFTPYRSKIHFVLILTSCVASSFQGILFVYLTYTRTYLCLTNLFIKQLSSKAMLLSCTESFTQRNTILIIINPAIFCQWKRNLASAYLGRCGDKWVTEEAKAGFPPSGDKGHNSTPCPQMLQPTWQEGSCGTRLKDVTQTRQKCTK